MTTPQRPLVVVTGASSGIGLATARLFSSHGHPLLLLARRLAPMQALNLPNALARQVDVTDRAALAAALREAEAQYGPADAIVNNAGVMLLGDITRQDPAQWDRMLDVNVKGLLNGVHAVAAGMVERGHGTIINISSVAGRKTFPNHVAYVGTKFAVHGLSENLREELSPHNVRVVTIAPRRGRDRAAQPHHRRRHQERLPGLEGRHGRQGAGRRGRGQRGVLRLLATARRVHPRNRAGGDPPAGLSPR
ncbi:SDR family oxidoreductase [Achromobacter dolens]|uniref:SDR family oxidoreductase n=3 Tax=Pseudomonadota TaxID=1224 RepID=UPI003B98EDA6